MTRKKILIIVKGYLLKEKRVSILTIIFLCCITIFLLVGNQFFLNVQIANQLNAEALEGKYHVIYDDILEEEFQKIQVCDFVAEAGKRVSLGQAKDGTVFSYIDEAFRNLSATVADKNVKQLVDGHWAKKENEVVFTKNYMEQYNLNLGDVVCVDLTMTDANTGDMLYQIPNVTFIITGVIENATGFTDRKMGYVSERFASSIMKENPKTIDVLVKFHSQNKITEDFQKLNEYLGYNGEKQETLTARKNAMLTEAVDDNGDLKNQNTVMNITIWIVCVMVVYNIFYNRFFSKKRDFINLRKLGFQVKDLLKITGIEFLIFILIGFITGTLVGFLINRWIYLKIMKVMIHTYEVEHFVSFNLSWHSVRNTIFMFWLISLPCIITAWYQLRKVAPIRVMNRKRENRRKRLLAFMIVSLSFILISILGIQNNQSDEGIFYVKTYVPGDFQLTVGSIFENITDNSVPIISNQTLQKIENCLDIKQAQSYEINYSRDVFLCEKKDVLISDSAYYEMLSEMEQDIDGEKQCLYNLILVTTDNMKVLVPSWDEKSEGSVAIMDSGLAQTLNLKNGDHFTIYDEALIREGSKNRCISADITLLDTSDNIILSENHLGKNLLIVDQKTAKLFLGEQSRQVVNIWAKEGSEMAAASNLRRIAEEEGHSFHNAKEQMQAYTDSDQRQRSMQSFFIVILALIGALTYFNTIFVNLMNRRNDFVLMHRIGIRRSEIYQMILKEGLVQGILTLTMIGVAQTILCINRNEFFPMIFVIIDVGVMMSCILFPIITLYYIFRTLICK